MLKEHINTFVILAARAQKAGLIEVAEMAAVAQAFEAAQNELKKENEQDIQNKARGRQTKD